MGNLAIIFFFIAMPFLAIVDEAIHFSLSQYGDIESKSVSKVSPKNVFFCWSYGEISYPEGGFEDNVKLNIKESKTKGEL